MSKNKLINKIRPSLIGLLAVFAFASTGWAATYYVATTGNDANSGTSLSQPWRTIQKAMNTLVAGDTVYVRGGQYPSPVGGWMWKNTGTSTQPITFTNYPGEQAILTQMTVEYDTILCMSGSQSNYIKMVGTDVAPRALPNGVMSKKGLVMIGEVGEQSYAFSCGGCDYWEIGGWDFVQTAAGVRTWKSFTSTQTNSSDYFYVHDNRVYNHYRETGMQFNGDHNRIENNEIYKVSDLIASPFGCALLNLLGSHNVVKNNIFSRLGSKAECAGIMFEWDLSDNNIIERNLIYDVQVAIAVRGGDNNIFKNNVIYVTSDPNGGIFGGIEIGSYDSSQKTWPCNEPDDGVAPPNNPAFSEYEHYYNPRNCQSYGTQIYNNVIYGFQKGVRFAPLMGENSIIRNNAFVNATAGAICLNSTCQGISGFTADHNASQAPFGFVDPAKMDFHLVQGSPLIGAGVDLGSLVPDDFAGKTRPQGGSWDIGAYEFAPSLPPSTPTALRFIH